MITLNKHPLAVGEGRTVSINVDDLIAVQDQPGETIGSRVSIVFVRNCPPLSVREKEEEIVKMVKEARKERQVSGFGLGKAEIYGGHKS